MPASIRELDALPFVIARVERCRATEGDVEILSLSTLGQWSRAVQLSTQPMSELRQEFPDAPLADSVAQAARDGAAYWRSGSGSWHSLSDTSAVAAARDGLRVRLTIIRTNALPGLVAHVRAPAA